MSDCPHVAISGVRFIYGDGTEALKGIDLEMRRGERIGLAGENGGGKTTLCKQINGLLRPAAGKVIIDGVDASETEAPFLARKVGYLFQNPDHQIFCSSVSEEIAFGLRNIGMNEEAAAHRVERYMRLLGIAEHVDKPPLTLSLGVRRLVSIASTLAMERDILMLDEPTAWLDHSQSMKAVDAIKEAARKDRTVIVVTHNMKLMAELTDRLIVMSDGRIVSDGPTKPLLSDAAAMSKQGLIAPPVSRLAAELGLRTRSGIATPEDFLSAIRSTLAGGGSDGPR
ncbi:MAG TPA: ABC transporter ATP-binding protein [Thermoplasmata archaeon]|nr:ABC transporter ATP-binding protein [Thermoplasmata archaeon]